jgi:hypothetical protein
MNKYHNRKVRTSDGYIHDSRKEAVRWNELKLMEKAGLIIDLHRQVKFVLIPAQYEADSIGKNGRFRQGKCLEREVAYIADFVYKENGELVVEDVKGIRTKEYIIKRKLMLYVNEIRIKEI